MTPSLCLGTAQFGLPYGITNTAGQVPESEVAQILAMVEAVGFRWLDTAQAYGCAEEVIGRTLSIGHRLGIITKLSSQPKKSFKALDVAAWENAFSLSCKRLRVDSLYSLILHSPTDLHKPGGSYLIDWLLGLRQRGLVQKLGVSIYSADDLNDVDPDLLDLVQLPLSLFDQRLLQDGTVAWLRARGTVIHARSLYLQGLLLIPAVNWPMWVPSRIRSQHQSLVVLANRMGCNLIDLVLGFAQAQQDLEAIVLGICSLEELTSFKNAWSTENPWQNDDWKQWALDDHTFLDPRSWPSPSTA